MASKPTSDDLEERLEALEREKAALERLYAMSPAMICIVDLRTSTFLEVNPAFTEVLGHSERTLLSRPFRDFIHPDDREATEEAVRRQERTRDRVFNFENRYRCADGSYRWLSWNAHPSPENGISYAIARDITEQKREQSSQAEYGELLEAVGRMADIGGWELDLSTEEVIWTQTTGRIHELPEDYTPSLEEAIGYYHPEDRQLVADAVERAIREGKAYDFEARLITATGRQRWVRAIGQPTVENGSCVRLAGAFQDITDQKRAQAKLESAAGEAEDARNTLRAVIDAAPAGIVVASSDGAISLSNQAADEIVGAGVTGNAYGPESGYRLLAVDGTALSPEELPLPIALERNEPVKGKELRIRRDDGTEVVALCSATPLRDGEGEARGAVAVMQDITELRQVEAQLHRSQKLEAIGTLAGGIAHDFNNQLTVVYAEAEALLEGLSPSNPLYESALEIRRTSKKAADLTRQLLAFGNRQAIRPKRVDLSESVAALAKMLRRLVSEHVELVEDFTPDPHPAFLDTGQVEQVVMNLVVNARDAMPDGGTLTISTHNRSISEAKRDVSGREIRPGNYVVLAVRDTGSGIEDEILDRIFDPFFTTKGMANNSGLGLSTVYGIASQNDAYILIDTELGRGTEFQVLFPEHPDPPAGPKAESSDRPTGTARTQRTVLLVEDDPKVLQVVSRHLSKLGHTVHATDHPDEAVELFEALGREVDVLVTDVVMPRMKGTELADRLRRMKPSLRVLFMSGYNLDALERDRIGASIQKPFTRDALQAALDELLAP